MMKKSRILCAIFLVFLLTTFSNGQTTRGAVSAERSVDLYIDINEPVGDVWKQVTTVAGLQRFFAPSATLELKPLGSFEVYFDPSAPAGQRGAEGNLILAVQENEMLSFTWDAPVDWPEVRKQRTFVTLRFKRLAASKTRVSFFQTGWGTTAEWDEVFRYFDRAWQAVVLPNLKYSVEVGPLDWTDFPNRLPQKLPPAKRLTKK